MLIEEGCRNNAGEWACKAENHRNKEQKWEEQRWKWIGKRNIRVKLLRFQDRRWSISLGTGPPWALSFTVSRNPAKYWDKKGEMREGVSFKTLFTCIPLDCDYKPFRASRLSITETNSIKHPNWSPYPNPTSKYLILIVMQRAEQCDNWLQQVCMFLGCLLSQPHAKRISGMNLPKQFDVQSERSCGSNSLSHPVTVNLHQAS